MARGRWVMDAKTGEWREGRASPELIPENVRGLPAEHVTKEIGQEGKVHALDPKHVKLQLLDEIENREDPLPLDVGTRIKEFFNAALYPNDKVVPLSQPRIDWTTMKIIGVLIGSEMGRLRADPTYAPKFPIRHIWFPTNNMNIRELREGNPPPDSERPRHMRGFQIAVDVFNYPARVKDLMIAQGIPMPSETTMLTTLSGTKWNGFVDATT